MKRLKEIFKQLLCKHLLVKTHEKMFGFNGTWLGTNVYYKCSKCGKQFINSI